MSLRSRSLGAGLLGGFLQGNRKKREEMNQRIQYLADNTHKRDSMIAANRHATNRKAQQAEHVETERLRTAGYIRKDEDGRDYYTDNHYKELGWQKWDKGSRGSKETYEDFLRKDTEGTYLNSIKSEAGKYHIRNYKDASELDGNYALAMKMIDAKRLDAANIRGQSAFDDFITGKSDEDVAERQARIAASTGAYDDTFNPMGRGEEQEFHEKLDPSLAPVAPIRNTQNRTLFTDTLYSAKTGDPITGDIYKNVVEDAKGNSIEYYEVEQEDGSFARIENATTNKPASGGILYSASASNVKTRATKTITVSTTALRSIDRAVNVYTENAFGTSGAWNSVTEGFENLFTISQSAEAADLKKKHAVEESLGLNIRQLREDPDAVAEIKDPMLRTIITNGGPDMLKNLKSHLVNVSKQDAQIAMDTLIARSDSAAKTKNTKTAEALNEKLRSGAYSAETQIMVRALIRSWTQGENKVAWGAAEKLLTDLEGSADEKTLIGKLSQYKLEARHTITNSMEDRFNVSKYGPAQNTGNPFIPTSLEQLPTFQAKENRYNPKTNDFLTIKSGKLGDRDVTYFYTAQSEAIFMIDHSRGSKADAQTLGYLHELRNGYTSKVYNDGTID